MCPMLVGGGEGEREEKREGGSSILLSLSLSCIYIYMVEIPPTIGSNFTLHDCSQQRTTTMLERASLYQDTSEFRIHTHH